MKKARLLRDEDKETPYQLHTDCRNRFGNRKDVQGYSSCNGQLSWWLPDT